MLRQLSHGRQPLARLPFPGAKPTAQVVLDPARGQLRSPWRHGVHDRKPGFLQHPWWSAFWDKRYAVWRVAEDDPDSALYAEGADAAEVLSYMTAHS